MTRAGRRREWMWCPPPVAISPITELRRLIMIKFTFVILEQLVCSAIYACAVLGVIIFTLSALT